MATPTQITSAIAGMGGVEAVRIVCYQTDRIGTVLADLTPAVLPGGSITLDNDRAVSRTITLTLDAALLPASFTGASASAFNIAPHYQAYVAGAWQDFPLGIFWLDSPWQSYAPGVRTWAVQGADLTNVLGTFVLPTTYAVAAGSNYLGAINSLIARAGLATDLGPGDPTVPVAVDFVWTAPVSLLTIINDLLAGLNYFPLWADANGVLQSRQRLDPAIEPPAVAYSGAAEPIMVIEPFRQQRGDLSRALNRLKALIDDPTRTQQFVELRNEDPSSPISSATLGYDKSGQLTSNSGTKCVLDIVTAQALVDTELRYANCAALPAELTTFPDPRRGNREFYTLSIADQTGAIVTNQQYRVAGWTLGLDLGAPMTHTLHRADALALSTGDTGRLSA